MPVALEYYSDHLLLRMVGPAVVGSLRRSIVVPYSDVRSVEVESPRWPSVIKEWRIGTHLPGIVAQGLFSTWGGHRRFLVFDRATKEVLTLHLAGHPNFHEISVEVLDPHAAKDELERRKSGR